MAKYTREQRQRAVELYVKYECCAADVIRELVFPKQKDIKKQPMFTCLQTKEYCY